MPFYSRIQIKESPISGKGMFTKDFIKSGERVWSWDDLGNTIPVQNNNQVLLNQPYTVEELRKINSQNELAKIIMGGYYCQKNKIFHCLRDGAQFNNHSFEPNIEYEVRDGIQQSCALRDIEAGQELTQNYFKYCISDSGNTPLIQLFQKYDPLRLELQKQIKEQILNK